MKKKIGLALASVMTICFSLICLFIPSMPVAEAEDSFSYKTLSEIGNPLIAGTGSYYDDGLLYYANTGCTIGYNLDHSNTIFEFDVIFDSLAFPSWFSLNLKASYLDRTQAAGLEQKGYSFVFFPSGSVQVWKPDMTSIVTNIAPISTGVKYRVQVGAVNVDNSVLLTLTVNGEQIINQLDSSNPYLTGNWFNICSDGNVTARLYSTKKEVYPDYYTYTLSTLGVYPLRAGTEVLEVDGYNNIDIKSSGATVGFNQYLQNFSLETNFNFSRFDNFANFWIGLRVGGFDRANSTNLTQKGYTFRLGSAGVVGIYKNGGEIGSVGYGFAKNTDYVIEFGTVDLDQNRTNVFILINNQMVLSVIDETDPIQEQGFITFNGDGDVACKITSVNTKVTPLMTKVKENEDNYVVETYFNNTISYTGMTYNDFSTDNLNAISVNDTSVYDINKTYYGINGTSQVNAVEVSYVDNRLILTISKDWYLKSTNATDSEFVFEGISIKKTSQTGGLKCPSGFVLKQTYYYSV